MRVSVIVPTVGREYLGDQLGSLAEQSVPPDEVIVVNNGVPGAVDDHVEAWRSRLPGLRLVEDRVIPGPCHARNVGAAQAHHPGLLFLDDDDVADRGYVEAMSRALDSAALVVARMDVDRLNPPALAKRWQGVQAAGPMTFYDFLPWGFTGTLGIRRDTFLEIGGFDHTLFLAEDVDLCWRAQLVGVPAPVFEPRAVLSYRLRSRPGPAFRQGRQWGRSDVGLYRRYRSRGLPPRSNQLRAAARWLRPPLLLVQEHGRMGTVEAARLLGERVGRLEGSVRERCLFL